MNYLSVTYIIREFDPDMNQILVEFDGAPIVPVLLPVTDGMYPVGAELETLIRSYTPIAFYEAQAAKVTVANASDIASLVIPPV